MIAFYFNVLFSPIETLISSEIHLTFENFDIFNQTYAAVCLAIQAWALKIFIY